MGDEKAWLGAAEALRRALEQKAPVAALTGAGVSAESGIPTFRGAGGLWKGFRAEELATPGAFRRDPERVWEWYLWRRGLVLEARPNPAHLALAALERASSPFTLVTQNVDGLHRRAGSEAVVELHGNIHHARCTACLRVAPLPEGIDVPPIPTCPDCGAPARPHIVWFGEMLPEEPWRQAYGAAATAAVLLVVGTRAAVHPAAGLIDVALAGGGQVVEVNPDETDVSGQVTWALRERAGVALPRLLEAAGVKL